MLQARVRLAAVLFFAVLLLPGTTAAQTPSRDGSAVISGRVVADDGVTVIPSANVVLRSAADSAAVAETLTSADGNFRFDRIAAGEYLLELSSIGYGTVTTQRFELATGETRNLGVLELPLDAVVLDAIEVSGERNAVTHEVDRTAYNVDVMPGTEGASVTETLEMIPDLEVDIDGGITLLGDAPAIYINGRPAPMTGETLAAFLEQFPADYLQRIEVLENPSARFDAQGSGGIINLVMKEGVELGLSGSVFANAGTRGQYGLGGRVTAQRGDLTLGGGGFVRLSDTERTAFDLRQNLFADPAFLQQDTWTDRSGLAGNFDLQARWDASERLQFFAEGRVSRSGSDSRGVTTTTHRDASEATLLVYDRSSSSDSRNVSADVSTGFAYSWEPRRHELEVELEFQAGRQRGDSRREVRTEAVDDEALFVPPALTLEEDGELERELSLHVDYTRAIGESTRVEFGGRAQLRDTDEDRLIRYIDDPDAALAGDVSDRGFEQRMFRNSVYGTLQRQFGALSAQLGLRAERRNLDFTVPGGVTFERAYTNLFPSANVAYRFDDARQVRLSYSRRIGTPSASVLNPTDLSTDPMQRRVGNPDIGPRFTHSLSLNATWSGSFGRFRLSPYYRRTTNDWTRITTVDDAGVETRTFENVAAESRYGANVTWSMRRRGAFGGNVSIGGRRTIRDASNLADRYSGASFRWSSRANLNAQVTDAFSVQGNFRYSPPTDLPQGRADASYRADFGVRYRLLDDRASIRLSLRDPFELRRSSSRLEDLTYVQIGQSRETTRSARLSVSYALGGGARARR